MKSNRYEARKIRHFRIRKKITGSELRPRLNVFRSNKNLYAQIIDDSQHRTLVSYSTLQMTGKGNLNKASATLLGEMLAKKALENNITTVVFDRGGYLYHGKIAAFAEAAREHGLKF
ncbi:50S ribosomal protein L18 [Spiroplasma endosymbiont of 'Nebria riversi']|uniref:50S ribosomal protein L18 n=1 Tax=Spiroplasma endosymbiont of 'Nebria riversi' TaxID=2792084 RepID=UPI002738ED39|nr:50S ribosomal protein L18 [Spiroplasma endosymbiont of 'Nebria riversi']